MIVEHLVVFPAEPSNDSGGLLLWAHVLHYVSQYMDWGMSKFAFKYITDWEAMEREADEKAASIYRFKSVSTDRLFDRHGS